MYKIGRWYLMDENGEIKSLKSNTYIKEGDKINYLVRGKNKRQPVSISREFYEELVEGTYIVGYMMTPIYFKRVFMIDDTYNVYGYVNDSGKLYYFKKNIG